MMNCEYFVSDNGKSECECKNCIYSDEEYFFCPADTEKGCGLVNFGD